MSVVKSSIPPAPRGVFRVGLTGGIGSGKSTVATLWKGEGVNVIDLDALSRAVLDVPGAGVEEAIAEFGTQFRTDAGVVDRQALGQLVFSDADARARLEAIVLGRVWEGVRSIEEEAACIPGNGRDERRVLIVHDSPLLLEKKTDNAYDVVVAVLAPVESRIRRVVESRGRTREYVESVMAAQVDDATRHERADILIDNYGTQEVLEGKALEVLALLRAANAETASI